MGMVVMTYKVNPDSDLQDVDTDAIAETIAGLRNDDYDIQAIETKPLAFGLKFVQVHVKMNDGEGLADAFEAQMSEIQSPDPGAAQLSGTRVRCRRRPRYAGLQHAKVDRRLSSNAFLSKVKGIPYALLSYVIEAHRHVPVPQNAAGQKSAAPSFCHCLHTWTVKGTT